MRRQLLPTLISLFVTCASPAWAFDSSDYRETTYGPPNHYCDPTRSLASNGTGTLGDPWNMSQCATQPVAGDVVGVLPGISVRLPTTNNDNIPAFNPRNSGTSSNRIVYVTKYAAVALSNVESNPNRTELRHDGSAPSIVNGAGAGTGCPMYGASGRSYITFDGFYVDMAQAYMKEDSGVIRAEGATGIHFRNFVIKGATLTVASNPVIYRPQAAVDTVLSNFRAYDFFNNSTGSRTPQGALFSDQYGDQNFLIEHFEIRNTGKGIFLKGSASSGAVHNYGTIRYGKIWDVLEGIRINDQDASNRTTIQYVVIYNYSSSGIHFSAETDPAKMTTVDHVTIANGAASMYQNGAVYAERAQSGLVFTNNIFDIAAGSNAAGNFNFWEAGAPALTANNNGYYRGGITGTWGYNATVYTALANWRAATGQETNSIQFLSDPFANRAGHVFTLAPGHAALTASSTGGQIGAYAGIRPVGVDISSTGTGDLNPPLAPTGVRIQ